MIDPTPCLPGLSPVCIKPLEVRFGGFHKVMMKFS